MPVTEMVVATSVGLFFLVAFIALLRLLQVALLHRTLRRAIDRDSPVTGGLIDRIASGDLATPRVGTDDRTGLILLALGLAIGGYSLVVNDPDWLRHGLGAALFPLLVGAALLARHRWARRSADNDLAAGA